MRPAYDIEPALSSTSFFSPYDEVMKAPAPLRTDLDEAAEEDGVFVGQVVSMVASLVWFVAKDKYAQFVCGLLILIALALALALLIAWSGTPVL